MQGNAGRLRLWSKSLVHHNIVHNVAGGHQLIAKAPTKLAATPSQKKAFHIGTTDASSDAEFEAKGTSMLSLCLIKKMGIRFQSPQRLEDQPPISPVGTVSDR